MSINFKGTVVSGMCTLVAALGVAGCGGSSGAASTTVSAGTYVSVLCGGMGSIVKSMEHGARAGESARTPQAIKAALENYLSSLAGDVSSLAGKASSVGVPSVKNGAKIAAAVVSGFDRLEVTLRGLAAQAKALPTSNLTTLTSAAQSLVTKASSALMNVNSLTSGPTESPALVQALHSSRACRALSAGSAA